MVKKIDGMLAATFTTTLFYSAAYPCIHKEIMTAVSDQLIAVSQIINCMSIVALGYVWNQYSDKLFRYYPFFCVAETVLGIGSTVWVICTQNIASYYMIDTLICAVVTRNICCGGVKFRAIRYTTETARERFDNDDNSAYAVATMIGSVIAMSLRVDFNIMLCAATLGNAIDNLFYIAIYKSSVKMNDSSQTNENP